MCLGGETVFTAHKFIRKHSLRIKLQLQNKLLEEAGTSSQTVHICKRNLEVFVQIVA